MTSRDFLDAIHPVVKRMQSRGAIAPSRTAAFVVFADLEGRDRERAAELAGQFHLFAGLPALVSGRFNGMLPVTRWEAGMVLAELLQRMHPEARQRIVPTSAVLDFTDLTATEHRRLEPLLKQGILVGFPDQTFRTQEPLTQAQWTAISERLKPLDGFMAPPAPARKLPSLRDEYQLINLERER